METLACDYDERSGESPAIGLIVLQSDEVLEHELRTWLPPDVRVLHARIPNSTEVTAATLRAMEDRLADVVRLLPADIDYSAIAYGCTSASTLIGEDRVRKLIRSVLPGVAVTNPITALKARLGNLGVSRIALLTPYVPAVSMAIADHLASCGITIVKAATFNEVNDNLVARISARSVSHAMMELGRHPDVDAVFGSCTNLRAATFIDDAEREIGKPMLTSNSVLAWHLERLIDAGDEMDGDSP